jgi:hypothetical protein
MKYKVFISYSHANARKAHRLQRALENYRIPKRLVGSPGASGSIPSNLKPVFLDRADLRGSSDLSREIAATLRESETLIVLCSLSAAASKWVDQEIREFQALGRQDSILAAIVDPGPRDLAADVMPVSLRRRQNQDGSIVEIEPLAVDFRKDGFRNAKLKLVAGILGIDFDSLKQRDKIRRSRRIVLATAAGFIVLLLSALTYIGLADGGAPLWAGNQIRRSLDEHDISQFRRAPSMAEIASNAAAVRRTLIPPELADLRQAATPSVTNRVLPSSPDGRLGGTWDVGQIVAGIAQAPEATASDIASAKRVIEILFEPGRATITNGVSYGWLWYQLKNPQAEAALWPIIAIAALMSRPGAISPDEQARFAEHLKFAENAASLYYGDGGWMHLPNQKDRRKYGLYTTLVGLEALLAVRDAHEQWAGRDLDEMISSTAGYLIKTYDDHGDWSNSPGWHGPDEGNDVTPIDSMTLFSYALLLKASAALPEKVKIPANMMAGMSKRATELGSAPIEPFTTDQDLLQTGFVDLDGKEKMGGYTWKYPWYPYALLFAKAWFDHLRAPNSDPADVVAGRRVLGKVVSAGHQLETRGNFYREENLWSLDHVR